MKTTHRQAARAKAQRRHELFDPGADITPQEHARRKRRAAERTPTEAPTWTQHWQPLTPMPEPPRRPGADDYLQHPSRIGDTRVPHHASGTGGQSS